MKFVNICDADNPQNKLFSFFANSRYRLNCVFLCVGGWTMYELTYINLIGPQKQSKQKNIPEATN